eukprot:gene17680-21062_t
MLLAMVNSAVPLSEVEPTAKPHRVMEHMPLGVHMSALTNVHANEAAPVGTLVDDTVQVGFPGAGEVKCNKATGEQGAMEEIGHGLVRWMSDVQWSDVQWSERKSLDVQMSDGQWSEKKSLDVQMSDGQWSDVQWSEKKSLD